MLVVVPFVTCQKTGREEHKSEDMSELRMLSDAALLAAAEKSKEGAKTTTTATGTFPQKQKFSTTMKKALPQSSNTTNGGDDSDDEDYVIGNLEWDSGGSGSDDSEDDNDDDDDDDDFSSGDEEEEDSSDKEEEKEKEGKRRRRMKVERSVSGKLSSSPTNKVRGECEELEYSESEEKSEDAGSDSDSDEKRAKRYEELEAEKFSTVQKQEKSTRAGVRRVQFDLIPDNEPAQMYEATRGVAKFAKLPVGKEVSKDIIRDTTGWIPAIASPMKALPGSLDFYERQIALNDINAPNVVNHVSGSGSLHYFSDSEDDDVGGYDNDALNRSASRPSAGPIARRTRARFNMDDVSLDELEQRLNTLPDEEEMMFTSEKDIYEDFLSAVRVIDTNDDVGLLDNIGASDGGNDGPDRNEESIAAVSFNTKGDNDNDDVDDDDDDDDEDFEDEDVRAREFQLKLRAERRRLERDCRDAGKENLSVEGEAGKGVGKVIPQHMILATRQSQRVATRNAQKLIELKRKSHMTKSQVHLLRDQIAIHSQLLVQTFALHACGEIKGFSTEFEGPADLSLNSEFVKWNKDMLDVLSLKFKARRESAALVVNVFDNDMIRNAAQFMGDVEEFARSVRPDLLRFTKEEGKLWMSPRDRIITAKSRHRRPNLHFSRIDCMFRVDDRTTCMDYPGAKRSEHVTDIAWKPANKQLVRLTREFALKTRMQRSYLPGENSLLSFLVPKLIGRCDQSEKKETKQGSMREYVPSRTKWLHTEDVLLAHGLLTFGCCSDDTCQDIRTAKQRDFMVERFIDVQRRFLPGKTVRAINDRLIQLLGESDGEDMKDTLWHANRIIRNIRQRQDTFLTREDILLISDVLESVKGLDAKYLDRYLLWRDIALKLETKFTKKTEYDSKDLLLYIPGLLSDQYERMKWSILRRGDEPAKRISASEVNPRAVVHRPNKKRRKPESKGRSSRQKMQEQNPNLQEHVVVLEELQYSESDESDEDFDEGEAEELEYSDSSELEDEGELL